MAENKEINIREGLAGMLSPSLRKHLEKVPQDLLDMPELTLKEKIGTYKEKVEFLRDAFWGEHHRSLKKNETMKGSNIYRGICSRRVFYFIVTDPVKMAYLCTPVLEYEKGLRTVLREYGVPKFKEILSKDIAQPIFNKDGEKIGEKIDTRLAGIQVQAIKEMSDRVMGMSTQKHEITENIKIESSENLVSMAELDAKIEAVSKRLNGEIIDAEFTEVENEIIE